MVRGLPKPTDAVAEKRQYILLMLLDAYEAHAGDIEDATTFAALVPSGDSAAGFAADVEAMFGITVDSNDSISSLVDRIYAAQANDISTAKDFVG